MRISLRSPIKRIVRPSVERRIADDPSLGILSKPIRTKSNSPLINKASATFHRKREVENEFEDLRKTPKVRDADI
jgi:hypothetical protein